MSRRAFPFETPYVNTIPASEQPPYPGDEELERRIRNIVRWNAMAMVVRANSREPGIGGHIATYASSSNLYEVAFHHFFRGHSAMGGGDLIFFQGHATPGVYSRAFLEGRITEAQLQNFRRELEGGLSSYPHPWLMPDFWEYPTVSMGLGPLQAIYQARFNRYLRDRKLRNTDGSRVWAFLGDGEMDEPESLGSLAIAAREGLDNLIFVVNCNLQRLDGPVRGNGKIIQELESVFRGAGWNVVKLIWSRDWDALLESDASGVLAARMLEALDGDYQKYVVESGAYTRNHFFGKSPELSKLVESLSDDKIRKLGRGGHDSQKIHAAFKAATAMNGRPTVVLAKTIKGYGLGEAGEGLNITHQQKKLNEAQLKQFRDRFEIPVADKHLKDTPFYKPPDGSPEIEYLLNRRRALGGFIPRRSPVKHFLPTFAMKDFSEFLKGTGEGHAVSTTMAFASLFSKLLRHPELGPKIVPIIPDEARTFGMDPLFKQVGIYSSVGQLYEPVDSKMVLSYRESKEGQVLEEGITEAGALASFSAAGTAGSAHDLPMIPFFIFYSMFGFQRVGDLIWSLQDSRARGFLLGATAGRTTLAGEGLQHQDGHSLLLASAFPRIRSYEPAFAYEVALLIQNGIRTMYEKNEDWIYYLTLQNENYPMPPMPENAEEGVLRGLYRFRDSKKPPQVHLLGSGSILIEVLRAQKILEEKFGVGSSVWSATSYSELRREALAIDRRNLLHPFENPKTPWFADALKDLPVVAASDWMKIVPEQIARWVPDFFPLGTDGMGRSESRSALRRFFEIDAEFIVIAVLSRLKNKGQITADVIAKAMEEFQILADKSDPFSV